MARHPRCVGATVARCDDRTRWGRRWSRERRVRRLARRARARRSAATTCGSRCAPARRARRSTGLDVEVATAQLGDRAALRRALRGVDRVFHVAGTTHLRATPAELVARQRRGHADRDGGGAARRRRARRAHVVDRRRRPGAAAAAPSTSARRSPPGSACPTRSPSTPPRPRRCASPRTGSPVVIVCPAHVFGRGDLGPTSTGVVRRFLLRRIPAYVAGRDQRRRRRRRRRRAPARRRARRARRALHPRHRNYTWDRLFAELGRLSGDRGAGARAAGRASRSRWPRRRACARAAPPVSPAEIRAAGALVDVQDAPRRGASSAGRRARTRTPSRRRCAGGRSGSATGCARAPRSQPARLAARRRGGAAPRGGSVAASPAEPVVLYRCRTPTDRLCACGRVARELRRDGLRGRGAARAVAARATRDEIDALTGQRVVPVAVLGREAICDSRRIVEHLRWRRSACSAATGA